VITHAHRTAISKFCGTLKDLSAVEITSDLARKMLKPLNISNDIDSVVLGMARQAGAGPNPARQVQISAKIPNNKTAYTLNMACGSGLLAISQAAQSIRMGHNQIVLAGGMESMTQVPFMLDSYRNGYRLGHAKVLDGMYYDGLYCRITDQLMGVTAETLANEYTIDRERQDEYSFHSHRKYFEALEKDIWSEEIIPLSIIHRKTEIDFKQDEHPRLGVTVKKMSQLPPVFDDKGSVTAANSSGITDGSALVLMMTKKEAQQRGFPILATVGPVAEAGVDPKCMGLGPVPATQKLMKHANVGIKDIDLVELNEAFAAQVLACQKDLAIPDDRLNVNGGSIALGHPIGCTGARIVVTLLHEMKRRSADLGLASLCISGGQGISALFGRA